MSDPLCPPRLIDGELYACGRTLAHKDPRANREYRCMGRTFICVECHRVAMEFIREARDGRARDKEWTTD
jgi:hypothetical protein